MNQLVLLLVTFPENINIQPIAEKLLVTQLAACIHTSASGTSFYRWQEQLCADRELTVFIETTSEHYAAVEQILLDAHPYELPKIISLPITGGLAPYLDWAKKCLQCQDDIGNHSKQ